MNFLTDPREGILTLRLADVLVYEWIGEKYVCVDLTGVSALVELRELLWDRRPSKLIKAK
jgi:hypothetical protein